MFLLYVISRNCNTSRWKNVVAHHPFHHYKTALYYFLLWHRSSFLLSRRNLSIFNNDNQCKYNTRNVSKPRNWSLLHNSMAEFSRPITVKFPFPTLKNAITDDYIVSGDVLGVGVSGKVYRIQSRKSGQKYALKVWMNYAVRNDQFDSALFFCWFTDFNWFRFKPTRSDFT